jgi:hypothetical protein
MKPVNSLLRYKPAMVVIAVVFIIVLGVITAFRAGPYQSNGRTWGAKVHRSDFTVYQAAGRAVLDGTDIYEARNSRGWAYVYPPPFALLMVPFALMPACWGALIWYLISVALTAWAVVMCAGAADQSLTKETDRILLYAVPILLVLGWFMSGAARGQASIMMSWLVVAAFFWHIRGRDALGGACLAGAILLKVIPAVLLGYFVWRKRWRLIAATFSALLIGALLLPAAAFGWHKNVAYLREWVDVVARPAMAQKETREKSVLNEQLLDPSKPRNQSLVAVIERLNGARWAWQIATALAVVMMIVTVWSARRARADTEMLVVSMVIVWMLLVPPVSESHYFIALLWPLTILTAEARGNPEACSRKLACVALIVFGVVGFIATCVKSAQFYGTLCWGTLGLWATLAILVARRTRNFQGAVNGGVTSPAERQ